MQRQMCALRCVGMDFTWDNLLEYTAICVLFTSVAMNETFSDFPVKSLRFALFLGLDLFKWFRCEDTFALKTENVCRCRQFL